MPRVRGRGRQAAREVVQPAVKVMPGHLPNANPSKGCWGTSVLAAAVVLAALLLAVTW
jgi:hypothetical protein